MCNILSDSKKFVKPSVVDEKHLNFIIGIEKKLTNLLKELKASGTISENDYKKVKPRISSFGVLYGLCKFSKEICEQNSKYFVASLDVECLFTNIPLEETIKICCDSLYKNQELLSNINKNQFGKLLRAALWNNYFLFDGILYQRVEGVTMGSPLSPSLASAFLAHEQIWLNKCPDEFKPVYYKR